MNHESTNIIVEHALNIFNKAEEIQRLKEEYKKNILEAYQMVENDIRNKNNELLKREIGTNKYLRFYIENKPNEIILDLYVVYKKPLQNGFSDDFTKEKCLNSIRMQYNETTITLNSKVSLANPSDIEYQIIKYIESELRSAVS